MGAGPSASVEIVHDAIIVRIHPNGGALGDPWSWCCVLERDPNDPQTGELKAAPRRPTREELEALITALNEHGIIGVRWRRVRPDGSVHWSRLIKRWPTDSPQ